MRLQSARIHHLRETGNYFCLVGNYMISNVTAHHFSLPSELHLRGQAPRVRSPGEFEIASLQPHTRLSLNATIEQVRQVLEGNSTEIRISYDDNVGQIVLTMLDRKNMTVLITLPSEEFIHVARQIGRIGGLITAVA